MSVWSNRMSTLTYSIFNHHFMLLLILFFYQLNCHSVVLIVFCIFPPISSWLRLEFKHTLYTREIQNIHYEYTIHDKMTTVTRILGLLYFWYMNNTIIYIFALLKFNQKLVQFVMKTLYNSVRIVNSAMNT